MPRKILATFSVFVFLFMFFSLSSAAEPVKIGALLTLTGPLAEAGLEHRYALELAVEHVNGKGGIKSLGGAPLKLVYGDSQAKTDVAVSEVTRLVEMEKVIAIIDMYPSVVTLAASSEAERLKVPYYAAISAATPITNRGLQYVFQQDPIVKKFARSFVNFIDYLGDFLGNKLETVVTIGDTSPYPKFHILEGTKFLKERGYKVLANLTYARNTPDVSVQIGKIRALNPHVVYSIGYLGDCLLIERTAERMGVESLILDGSGKAHTKWLERWPKNKGEFTQNFWGGDISPQASSLSSEYKSKSGKVMTGHSALMYQGILVLAQALQVSGSYQRDALRDALLRTDIVPGEQLIMPYKGIKFNEKGLNIRGDFIFSQIQDRNFVTVFPDKWASKKIQMTPKLEKLKKKK